MSVDKAKAIAETVKIALDIVTTIADRSEKRKAREKRIADLEAELAALKGAK